ncbi:MAG: DUF885 domain-containing protein [Thermoplasmata archaeon]
MNGAPRAEAERASEFESFLARDWEAWIQENPEMGTVLGMPDLNDRWTDDSEAGIDRRRHHLSQSLSSLRAFHRDDLPPTERLNFDLYLTYLEDAAEGLQYGLDPFPFAIGSPRNLRTPVNQLEGIQSMAGDMVELQPRSTLRDYRDLLARLRALPAAIEQCVDLLGKGRALGYTPPRIAVEGVPDQISNLIPADPASSPLLDPFRHIPDSIPSAERSRLIDESLVAYREQVVPAFKRFRTYFASDYLPACREQIGVSALPKGGDEYRFLVKQSTTTELTPAQIHEIGLAEVRRLDAAIQEQMTRAGFTGSYAEFKVFLRKDPRFYWTRAEDLINGYRIIAKKIDPELGRLFGRLPRLPYGVRPVPAFREATSPAAYYFSGSPTTGRAGTFYASTYQVEIRPRWEMEALTLHEAVPGHHLQIALAQEMEQLPTFRRETGPTAFCEGWGLYAESLGEELGCYQDPYSKIGQMTFDLWRSIRLVVDTGMHALGWSRDQAIQFFHEYTGMSDTGIRVEVDRYIVWPGQALAYKIGQLKFRELRTWAEQRLGDRFDIRAFHDMVLEEGALPLHLVEERVRTWVASRSAG